MGDVSPDVGDPRSPPLHDLCRDPQLLAQSLHDGLGLASLQITNLDANAVADGHARMDLKRHPAVM